MKNYLCSSSYFLSLRRNCLLVALLGSFPIIPANAKSSRDKKVKAKQEKADTASKSSAQGKVKAPKKQQTFKKEQTSELMRSTTQLGVSVGLIFGLYKLTGQPLELSTLVGPLVGSLVTDPLKSIGSSCTMLFCPSLAKPRLNEAIGLKKQYEARKETFSSSIQSFTEEVLNQHIFYIQRFDYYSHESVNVIKEILQFPVGPKKLVPDTAALHQLMRNYPEEVRLAIGQWVATMVNDAKSTRLTKKATPIMFVGPPGTGKTYLAKQLATLLELPVQSIDLSNYKNVYGAPYYSSNPDKGVIAEALIGCPSQEQNWSNKILVLDEIDKALALDKDGRFLSSNGSEVYRLLHTLLEAQEVAIPLSRYNNASPDISQLKIVLVANKTFTETLTEDRAAALESRVKIIRFDEGFTPEKKQAIATTYVDQLLTKKDIDPTMVDQKVIEAIIVEDSRIGLKGVRVLLSVIDRYIDALKSEQLISEIAGMTVPAFDVQQAYAPYQPKPKPKLNDKKSPNKQTKR